MPDVYRSDFAFNFPRREFRKVIAITRFVLFVLSFETIAVNLLADKRQKSRSLGPRPSGQ
jgi:hypothetical protein